MLINPLNPFVFVKISSLKATVFFLIVLLIKSNLLRVKGGLIGGLFALTLLSGILITSSVAVGALIYAFNEKNKANTNNENNSEETIDAVAI